MNVEQLMSRNVSTCSSKDTLDCAARVMWEKDCGVVPVVDAEQVVGVSDMPAAHETQQRLASHKIRHQFGLESRRRCSLQSNDRLHRARDKRFRNRIAADLLRNRTRYA